MAVPAAVLGREAGEDDVRPEQADHPDDVAQDLLLAPEFEGLLGGLGIAEIDGPGEELLGPVDPAGGQELLRPEEADLGPFFRADQILAAFAPGHREIGGPEAAALREIGQDGGILVVRMGADEKGAAEDVELLEGQGQFPAVGNLALLGLGGRGDRKAARAALRKIDRHVFIVGLALRPERGRRPRRPPSGTGRYVNKKIERSSCRPSSRP